MSTFKGEIEDLPATARMASEAMLDWLKQIDGYRGLLALVDETAGVLDDMDGADQADVDDPLELRGVVVDDSGQGAGAGAVDDDIDAAKSLNGLIDETFHHA